jgi:hypothetical protein
MIKAQCAAGLARLESGIIFLKKASLQTHVSSVPWSSQQRDPSAALPREGKVSRDRQHSDHPTCCAPSAVFSFSKSPGPLWGPPSLTLNGNGGLFTALGESDRGVNLTTHFHLVPRLRASGVLRLFPLHAFMTCPETASHARCTPHFLPFLRIEQPL